VNADDLGWNRGATDLTIASFGAGQVTSATALVHMEDSERAAALALENGLPTGLHLNLSDPFTGTEVPAAERERHAALCRHFAAGRPMHLRSWVYDPRIQGEVEWAIEAQLDRHRELYGAAPTHVDGHNHVQNCPNVALAKALRGFKRRGPIYAWPATPTAMGRVRAARQRLIARRVLTTRYLFDIARIKETEPMAAAVGESRLTSVEVMAHPGFGHEHDVLDSAAWRASIEGLPTGSYADLI
jgi:predicted glycoside hydrolase/deacetylase ChbG (UPF0249 family)